MGALLLFDGDIVVGGLCEIVDDALFGQKDLLIRVLAKYFEVGEQLHEMVVFFGFVDLLNPFLLLYHEAFFNFLLFPSVFEFLFSSFVGKCHF